MLPTSIALVLFLWAVPLMGQESPDSEVRTAVFVVPGLLVSPGSGWGVAGRLVVERRRHRYSAHLAGIFDLRGFPDSGGGEHVTELGLMYGRSWQRGAVDWSFSGGIAATGFSDCGDAGPSRACTTLGVPLAADAVLRSRIIGVGLQIFGNLNLEGAFGGIGLVLPIGWMP